MKSETKTMLGMLLVIVVIFGIIVMVWKKQDAPANLDTLIRSDSYSMGPVDAKVTIVEFADFQCPACAAADVVSSTCI